MLDEPSTRKPVSRLIALFSLIGAGLLWIPPAYAREIPFGAEQSIGTFFDAAISVDLGDIDKDGDLDVVGAASGDGDISWWENTAGDGSAWTERVVATDFPQIQSVRLEDLDSDGDLDILAASRGDSIVRFWRNQGQGMTWATQDIQTAFSGANFAIAADMDKDGALDVVASSLTGVTWWENRFVTGVFWVRNDIEVTGDQPTSLAVADLDSDGDPDVLATLAGTDEVVWYENTAGNASAWTRRSIATGFDGAQSVAASDVDGDGDLDVVGAAVTDDTVAWWENTAGDGGAWTEHVVDAGIQQASSVDVRDLDGDGDMDILGAAAALGELEWWENVTGDGSAWTGRPLPGTFFGAAAALAGDIDDDGDLDVVASALGADAISWWENDLIHRSAAFPAQSVVATPLGQPESVHSGDLDGDGDEDLVAALTSAGDVLWWENTSGDGATWNERTIDSDFAGVNGVYVADVDRDGDLDVGGTSGSQGLVVWWRNENGDGSAWTRVSIASLPQAVVPQLIDIDEDGDIDIVAVSPQFFRVVSWINLDGVGGSWFQRIAQGNYPGARSSHAIDFDGDDRPDLATTASTFNAVSLVRNPVTGFQTTIFDGNFPQAYSAFGADLDGDGDNDIVAASRSTGELVWYDNADASGNFAARQTIATGFTDVNLVRAADFDGDGDFDVYATGPAGDRVAWWENGGDGQTWTARTFDGDLDGATWAHAADIDGDGRLDVAAVGLDGGVSWWRNRGGELALPTADVTPALVTDGAAVAVLRIDATHRGRAGDSPIELATVEVLLESAPGTPATDGEAGALLSRLSVHADDGSGAYEAGNDAEIAGTSAFALQDGVVSLGVADGLAAAQITAASSRSYFVVLTLTPTASTAMLPDFRVTHVTEASSTGEDAANDLAVELEFTSNVSSSMLTFNTAPTAVNDAVLLFEDQTAGANVLDGTAGGQDTDNEGGQLTATLVTPPSSGVLVGGLASDGTFQYAPALDFNGVDSFTYRASDGLATSQVATVTLTVTAVNDPPFFALSPSHSAAEDAGPQSVAGFASAIAPGPADESGQGVSFSVVSNSNPGLFAAAPALSSDGTLTYEAAADAVGVATVEVRLGDDGGTANGGVDQSAPQSVDITVSAVNDAPSFSLPSSQAQALEDAGPQTMVGFAADISAGPADEAGQVVTFSVLSNDNPGLFAVSPALSADGTLTFEAAADANGTANLTVELADDGGDADGGSDVSAPQAVAIIVAPVNDGPSFTVGAGPSVSEDAVAQSLPGFAGGISPGPADEAGQVLNFLVSVDSNPSLFAAAPSVAADGTLTFTAAADAVGSSTVSVSLMDDGGTLDGGVDTSVAQTFDITVTAINDPPTFAIEALSSSQEDAGAQQVANFASAISPGPDDEAGQAVSFLIDTVTEPGLFASGPSLAADGTLTYTAAADANGVATVTVRLMDDGGVDGGGSDQSPPQDFDIEVLAVNDAPAFSVQAQTAISADSAPQTVSAFATGISAGPADEAGQGLSFEVVSVSAPELFDQAPTVDSLGDLSFALVPGLSDVSVEISLRLQDDGGTALGGEDTSATQMSVLVVPDVVSPQVTEVNAEPGGILEACSEFRQAFSRISVTFSEAMSVDGADAATLPANYQLIASGPDRDIDTVACDALQGDDVRILADGVTPAEVRDGVGGGAVQSVAVDWPLALGDGLYKLLVCDAVADTSGNRLDSTFDVAFRVSSENLFVNGQFDCDLEPWVSVSDVLGGFGVGEPEFAYSPEDADDSALSGSLSVTAMDSSRFAVAQCLDLPSSSYDLSARVRVEGLSGVEVAAELRCERFQGAECAGASVGESVGQFTLTPTDGDWQLLEFAAPGGESAICGLDLELTAGASFEAFVDQLEASTRLFVDGFETGDTGAWTNTVPEQLGGPARRRRRAVAIIAAAMPPSEIDFTGLLAAWTRGDQGALEQLTEIAYAELRSLAVARLRRERGDSVLQPTELVNEMFLRLLSSDVSWSDRSHFYRLAARTMRRVLVDQARARGRQKRGSDPLRITLEDWHRGDAEPIDAVDLLALDQALRALEELDPEQANILELYFFSGLTLDEITQTVGRPRSSVHRLVRSGQAWLYRRLRPDDVGTGP
ncbi:MAG: ECF-type sigma factor [Acidobacteriota bacterium]